MGNWPDHKQAHAMGHYSRADIPFQFAMAEAFTICDAYHCSMQVGTNSNRLFLWTGGNDPTGTLGGPSISNSHDTLPEKGGAEPPYLWTTYPERLQAAGISWRIYEDMADNFGDNPLVGFQTFRDSLKGVGDPKLAELGLSTWHLDKLLEDVKADRLPSVSWVVSPAKDSEHPGPSSPAQGADYTARVLDCLTSNPDVWAKTVLFVMFDENDGFFDHMPPPSPPSLDGKGGMHGKSTVSVEGDYHLVRNPTEARSERDDLMGRPYGLGPRVPMYVISPWSRGGWVNAEVSDHTSVIRFCEARFGVMEPNITPWRRAVCGDLTSCFDFKTPNEPAVRLPQTADTAARAAALPGRTTPPTPGAVAAPSQDKGARPSRALGYDLQVWDRGGTGRLELSFVNFGRLGAVFHVYDRRRLDQPPRRYTVEAGKRLDDAWPEGPYDVSIYGPNGFYRRFSGSGAGARPVVETESMKEGPRLWLRLSGADDVVSVGSSAYEALKPGGTLRATGGGRRWDLAPTRGWYDLTLTRAGDFSWRLRMAGRVDDGRPSTSDPAMGGAAVMAD
jgi:phospholipase C